MCGDSMQGCIACTLNGICKAVYDQCANQMDCVQYAQCSGNCPPNDPTCTGSCDMKFPTGSMLYKALVKCVICDNCTNDCAGFGTCP
jgi:hypothetical protein